RTGESSEVRGLRPTGPAHSELGVISGAIAAEMTPSSWVGRSPPPSGLGLLDLDLDVDPGRQFESLQRVDRLRRRLENVEQPLVHAHLEVLAAVLVLVR